MWRAWRIAVRIASGTGNRCCCVDVSGYTTIRQRTHGTEVEVHYRWHPWCGRTVQVLRSVSKQPGTVLRVCEDLKLTRPLEIPSWMVDSGICASMRFSEVPVVEGESLGALKSLLERYVLKDKVGVIKHQHFSSSPRGDADANKTIRRLSDATRFTSTATDDTSVGRVASAGQGAGTAVAGAAAQGASPQGWGTRKPKGGG